MDAEPTMPEDLETARELVSQLTEALRTRTTISCAKGILMERYDVDDDRAMAVLKRLSSHSQQKVHEVAARIVAGDSVESISASARALRE